MEKVNFVHDRCTGCTSVLYKLHNGAAHFVHRVCTKCFKTMHHFLELFIRYKSMCTLTILVEYFESYLYFRLTLVNTYC